MTLFIRHYQALGVLLYKLCYYANPFDSKMAILNGKYATPAFPQYSQKISMLIGKFL